MKSGIGRRNDFRKYEFHLENLFRFSISSVTKKSFLNIIRSIRNGCLCSIISNRQNHFASNVSRICEVASAPLRGLIKAGKSITYFFQILSKKQFGWSEAKPHIRCYMKFSIGEGVRWHLFFSLDSSFNFMRLKIIRCKNNVVCSVS